MAVLIGADGCRGGWVAVIRDVGSGAVEARVLSTEALFALEFAVLAIDIPIGLPDAGPREADRCARAFLGRPRGSSVFPAPIRPAVDARTREEASRITQAADGRRVGVQSFGILPKIREVDRLLRPRSEVRGRVFEVHPEVSFAAWAGQAMGHAKKRSAGKRERQALIAREFGDGMFPEFLRGLGGGVAADDLADGFAALWSAARIHAGWAVRLPKEPAVDSTGLPMHIWY